MSESGRRFSPPGGPEGPAGWLALKDRALDVSAEGITIADAREPDRPLIYANEGFERMTGYPVEEVMGRNCRFLQGPETDPSAMAEIRAALAESRECVVEILNYRKNGSTFWNRLSITPVRDAVGRSHPLHRDSVRHHRAAPRRGRPAPGEGSPRARSPARGPRAAGAAPARQPRGRHAAHRAHVQSLRRSRRRRRRCGPAPGRARGRLPAGCQRPWRGRRAAVVHAEPSAVAERRRGRSSPIAPPPGSRWCRRPASRNA